MCRCCLSVLALCRELDAELLRSTGFQEPILVHPTASVADTRKVHILCLPQAATQAA